MTEVHYWKHLDEEDLCRCSTRDDGRHSWEFDGDDPYLVCYACNEMRDALTGRVIRFGSGSIMR